MRKFTPDLRERIVAGIPGNGGKREMTNENKQSGSIFTGSSPWFPHCYLYNGTTEYFGTRPTPHAMITPFQKRSSSPTTLSIFTSMGQRTVSSLTMASTTLDQVSWEKMCIFYLRKSNIFAPTNLVSLFSGRISCLHRQWVIGESSSLTVLEQKLPRTFLSTATWAAR